MLRGIFVTGTDTGVGKTLFAGALAAFLRREGYRVGVMKPAETGCAEVGGRLLPEDARRLKALSGCEASLEEICPYSLREPLAPAVAAELDGVAIDPGRIQARYLELRDRHEFTIVEGAGGLLVPLLPHYTNADLARLLELPAAVVVANRLGALNHTLLTLECAAARGVQVLGYVLNGVEPTPSLAARTNAGALRFLTAVPCWGTIPHLEGLARGERVEAVLEAFFQSEEGLRLMSAVAEALLYVRPRLDFAPPRRPESPS